MAEMASMLVPTVPKLSRPDLTEAVNLRLEANTRGSRSSLPRSYASQQVMPLVSVFLLLASGLLADIKGWMCALGWQSYVPGAANVGATALQGIGVIANRNYRPQAWHTVLITILFCLIAPLFNTVLARRLAIIEGIIFLLYLVAFLVFVIVLLTKGTKSSGEVVFLQFQDQNDWGSIGTACFVGLNGPVITLLGSDSAVHLAEELRDASRNLPRAMLSYAALNYTLGFVMLLVFLFVLGDIDTVLNSPTGQPWIEVIWNATRSFGGTIAMVAIVAFFFLFASVNTNTTSSRQLFAFARDGGLPYSSWISRVSCSSPLVAENF